MVNLYQINLKIIFKMARTKSNPQKQAGSLKRPRNKATKRKSKSKTMSDSDTLQQLRKKKRFRPGTVALREIKRQQMSTKMIIAKAPFRRLVREITNDLLPPGSANYRITKQAFDALQAAAEDYLSRKFKDATTCAVINNRQAVLLRDWKLALALEEGNKRPLSNMEYSRYTGLSVRGMSQKSSSTQKKNTSSSSKSKSKSESNESKETKEKVKDTQESTETKKESGGIFFGF